MDNTIWTTETKLPLTNEGLKIFLRGVPFSERAKYDSFSWGREITRPNSQGKRTVEVIGHKAAVKN